MSSSTKCVHCGADSNPPAFHGYCVACGKETTPVRVPEERTRLAHASARQSAARLVSQILLGVGCLHLLCLGASFSVAPMLSDSNAERGNSIVITAALTVAIAVIFGGLGWWARFRPLPAALAGFAFYALVLLANLVANPNDFVKGYGGKAAVIMLLIWAVVAAVRARKRAPLEG
jgi:hypothetical protein